MSVLKTPYLRLLLLLPSLVAVWLYAPAVDFGYVWDDRNLLVQSAKFRSWDSLQVAIQQPFLTYQSYYRPLPLLLLGAEQLYFDGHSFAAHSSALGLFALNVLLLGIVGILAAENLGKPAGASLAIGLIAASYYAVHPVMIESVAWVSCRFDLMLTTFVLCTLIADLCLVSIAGKAIWVPFFFLLAALCKETAVAMALVFPAWHYFLLRGRSDGGVTWKTLKELGFLWRYIGLLCAGLAYLWLRHQGIGHIFDSPALGPRNSGLEQLLLVFKTLGAYCELVLWPFTNLSPLHGYLSVTVGEYQVWLGVAALLLAGGIVRWKAQRMATSGLAFLLCFVLSLIPVLNILLIPMGENFVQERFLTLPLIFMALAAAFLLNWIWRHCELRKSVKVIALSLTASFWLLFSYLNISITLPFWRSNLALWTYAYERRPDSMTAIENLQAAYIDAGLFQQAREFCEKTLPGKQVRADSGLIFNYLFALIMTDGSNDEIQALLRMVEQAAAEQRQSGATPTYQFNLNTAWLHLFTGAWPIAETYFKEARRQQALNAAPNYGLSVLYFSRGHEMEGQYYFRQAMSLSHPDTTLAFQAGLPGLVSRAKAAHR